MSPDRAALKIGVIGCGLVAESQHLPALASLPTISVTALADTNATRLSQVSERFHIPQSYTDYQTLLADPSIDAVAVCVPVKFHAPVFLAALDADKHVFVEKPLAPSLPECQQMAERAARSPKQAMVGFNLRWHPMVQEARRFIRSGALGRIEAIRSVFSSGTRYRADAPEWRKKRALGGGALIEVGIHHYDLWRFLLAGEIGEISVTSRSAEWDDQTVSLTGCMVDGTLISSVFTVASGSENQIELYGEKGCLRISLYRSDGLEFLPSGSYDGDVRMRVRRLFDMLRRLAAAAPITARGGYMVWSYRRQWEHFVTAVREGMRVDCTVEDGKRAMEIVSAALESARCNKTVRVTRN